RVDEWGDSRSPDCRLRPKSETHSQNLGKRLHPQQSGKYIHAEFRTRTTMATDDGSGYSVVVLALAVAVEGAKQKKNRQPIRAKVSSVTAPMLQRPTNLLGYQGQTSTIWVIPGRSVGRSPCSYFVTSATLSLLVNARAFTPREVALAPSPNLEADFIDYAYMIKARHPLIQQGFCFADGLNIPVDSSSDGDVKNAYNGWTCSHHCSSIMGSALNGCLIFSTRYLYDKLLRRTPDSLFVIADTAFPRNEVCLEDRIKAPKKTNGIVETSTTARTHCGLKKPAEALYPACVISSSF
ncbi:putative DDE Tnp4 domain-containing protein, partial [Phytophthora infestans]